MDGYIYVLYLMHDPDGEIQDESLLACGDMRKLVSFASKAAAAPNWTVPVDRAETGVVRMNTNGKHYIKRIPYNDL